MKHAFLAGIFLVFAGFVSAEERDVVPPTVPDKLERVTLNTHELGGEIDRRINDLIYKNYMVVDLDKNWLDYFRNREVRGEKNGVYYGIGKVIDAGSLFAQYSDDPKVAARTQYLIDELRKTRDADGYLGFWTVEPNNQQNHINWILHEQEYINLALTRNFRTTGNDQSREDAKIMANYIMKSFPKDDKGVYYIHPGISIAGVTEGFIELYRITGDEKYFDYAKNLQYEPHWFYEPFDEWEANIPNRGFHLYVMLSHMYPETELYRLTGNADYLKKSNWMKNALLEEGHGALLVTGSSSEGEQFTYNQNGAGAVEESCVTAYLLRLFDSLLRIEGDLHYGNVIERTTYNALFAAQEPNGRRICYFTPFTGKRNFQDIDTFCCNGNFRRAVAELPKKVYYRTENDGIVLNLFAESDKTFDVKDQTVRIQEETNYPNSGDVKLTFTVSEPVEFAFRFRTPLWCEKIQVVVNDDKAITIDPTQQQNGGYEINRTWKSGDTVEISMPIDWRLIRGRATQQGRFALMRGPILFCIGEAQNAELLKSLPEGFAVRDLVIDPESLGQPVLDTSIRPDGQKVSAKAYLNQEKQGEPLDVVFTEFTDPSGLDIYFELPESYDEVDAQKPVRVMNDELFTVPRTKSYNKVISALYGPKSDKPIEEEFVIHGTKIADIAADYVAPNGDTNLTAEFSDSAKTGTWTVLSGHRIGFPAFEDAVVLKSDKPVYETPLGYAYGQPNGDPLGFLANHDPSPNQNELWKMNFTSMAFDRGIPKDQWNQYLFTHPLADPANDIVVRWTPNKENRGKELAISAEVLSRISQNGVNVTIIYSDGKNDILLKEGTTSNVSSANNLLFWESMARVPAKEFRDACGIDYQYIDFCLSCGKDYMNDSTAFKFQIFVPDESSFTHSDVTKKVLSVFKNKIKTDLGNYTELFGDPAPGQEKTLKLKLRDDDTGKIYYKEFPENAVLEL